MLNVVLKKVQEKHIRICFSKIAKKENLRIIGISDASFKSDDKLIGGVFLFLADDAMKTASPLYWNSKEIE